MKITLTTQGIIDALRRDEYANWSYNGARALAEGLEELEECTEQEMELDVVAIRCDFAEHGSFQEWADDYFTREQIAEEFPDLEGEELDEAIREYITDNGWLIEFDGGIIVSKF